MNLSDSVIRLLCHIFGHKPVSHTWVDPLDGAPFELTDCSRCRKSLGARRLDDGKIRPVTEFYANRTRNNKKEGV